LLFAILGTTTLPGWTQVLRFCKEQKSEPFIDMQGSTNAEKTFSNKGVGY
jgi:hypothetical protein